MFTITLKGPAAAWTGTLVYDGTKQVRFAAGTGVAPQPTYVLPDAREPVPVGLVSICEAIKARWGAGSFDISGIDGEIFFRLAYGFHQFE